MLFSALGYVHRTVNHRQCFVNSQGIHTNRIEPLWAQCKNKLKRMKDTDRAFIPSYLDEFYGRGKEKRTSIA